MAVGLEPAKELKSIRGVRLGCAGLGNRATPRDDLTLIQISDGSRVAATFTRNAFRAAPVTVAEAHLQSSPPSFLLINAGNANAGTGRAGLSDALNCCNAVAAKTGCREESVLPFSTGVVGERLAVECFPQAIERAQSSLSENGWLRAAGAIMTTDTVAKGISVQFESGGETCSVTGIAKGSGMIRPDMATMLSFLATDAAVAQEPLTQCLRGVVDRTFNRITVDGDTSTNDACVLIATGQSGGGEIDSLKSEDGVRLFEAVETVCRFLAQAIIRDGEGATKFLTITASGGASESECLAVAYTVAHSPLVKTAMFASDPNWGRILAAVGRAGLADFDLERVRISIGDVSVAEHGALAAGYREQDGKRVMSEEEITVHISLERGDCEASVWTCDLSHGYVTINAEYRT
ncbi:MAG TPA: bifunctional glutamate N-acetyltransferase/amino-acid acetyltransferase ArgJ [Gammaproteobacteria bacterium]